MSSRSNGVGQIKKNKNEKSFSRVMERWKLPACSVVWNQRLGWNQQIPVNPCSPASKAANQPFQIQTPGEQKA
jgi:hypothetical protein